MTSEYMLAVYATVHLADFYVKVCVIYKFMGKTRSITVVCSLCNISSGRLLCLFVYV